jgi:hypothetical protein
MAKLTLVDKKAEVDSWTIVKIQVMLHCELNKINISEADTNALVQLIKLGETELSSFCIEASSDPRMFKSPQSVRNFVSKAERQKLIVKNGSSKKKIQVNPELGIITNIDNILLDYKLLCRNFSL